MMSDTLAKAMNEQINAEFYSAYLYLSMSAWCEAQGLAGSAHWLRLQAQEESVHAMKIYDYLAERDAAVKLTAIDEPPTAWDGPLAIFEGAYEHEQKVTAMIDNLVNVAQENSDHAAVAFLQWFVTEQVEEESSAREVADKFKMVGDNGGAMYMIDKELAQRVFTPPADEEG